MYYTSEMRSELLTEILLLVVVVDYFCICFDREMVWEEGEDG